MLKKFLPLKSFSRLRSSTIQIDSQRVIGTSMGTTLTNPIWDQDLGNTGVPVDEDGLILERSYLYSKYLILHNPSEYNRFDLRFCKSIMEQVKRCNSLPLVKLIVLRGGGTRAFSHGINHFDLYDAIIKGDRFLPIKLFREMYKTSFYVSNISTPTLSMINGSMLSGGSGIGAYADYTVATPGSVYSVPDCSFGFFPDNGNTYLLSRVDKKYPGLGTFMALTGAALNADDLVHAGIATHFGYPGMEILAMEGLSSFLEINQRVLHDNLVRHLCDLKTELAPPTFLRDLDALKRTFHDKTSVESIIESLEKEDSEWARNTLEALEKNSPLSLKVTLKAMNEAASLHLQSVYKNDYRVALRMVNSPDFKEGIEKVLKSQEKPVWSKTLSEISDAEVDSYFAPLNFDQDLTCDLVLPDEVFMAPTIKNEMKKLKF